MRETRKGFTLAEILITLTIIGVVASLTIPTLVNNIGDQQNYIKWRKTFSALTQATNLLQSQYGDIDMSTFASFRDEYGKVMSFIVKDSFSNIFSTKYTLYKNSSGTVINYGTNDTVASATLADGTCMRFGSGDIRIDINGKNGPNMFGKDYFVVGIVKRGSNYTVVPSGISGDGKTCENNSQSVATSDGCSAMALYSDNMP